MCELFDSITQKTNFKNVFLLECVFNIVSDDLSIALLFEKIVNFENISSILKLIYNKIPKDDETINIRWSIQSFLEFPNQNSEEDMSSELAMKDFLTINDQAMNFLTKYIDYSGEIKKNIAHDLSFYIQLLRDDYPGIFYSILPKLQSIISKIRIDRVYKAIGPNFISFYLKPPIDFINQIDEFDEQELSSFFQFPNNFTQQELTLSLQTKITNTFPYPSLIKGLENSVNFTLVNSSFCTENKHFIDFAYQIIDIEFSAQSDSKKIQKLIEPFFEFFPFLVVANQTILLREKNQYLQNLVKLFDNLTSPPPKIIESFQNDFRFLNFISGQTGKKFGYGDFFIDSFPFLLKTVIHKTSEIVKFSNLNFFSIKDDKALNDFDFVRCYGVLYQLLSFCKNYPQTPTTAQLNKFNDKTSNLLNSIKDEKTRSKIIIDLFSCIFIQDKSKHEFLCHPLVAHQLISVLITFSVPSQIYRANALFDNKKITKYDTSIVPWFDNDPSYIYTVIENKNWLQAEKLTAFLPYYIKFYSEAIQVDKYLNENDESVSDSVKVNVLLSLITKKDKLTEIQNKAKFIDHVNTIIEWRLEKDCEIESLCFPFDNRNKCQQLIDFAIGFDESLETSLKKIKNFQQNHSITETSKNFDDFLNYLYKYYRCAILIDSSTFDSIEDLFNFNFQKAVEGSILHDQMIGANELTKCVNVDLTNYIFDNLSCFKIDANLIEGLADKYPLESTALAVSNHIKASLPGKMKSISDYFEFLDKMSANDVSVDNISFESIFDPDFDDFDDLIFSVDHGQIYRQLMLKFDNEAIATQYYKLFSYVSYVSPESDNERIMSIETYHKVCQITDKKEQMEIVTDLHSKGNEYFMLIIDYILYWIKAEEQCSLIVQLFTLSLSNIEQIEMILQTFPEHFDVILGRTYYFKGVLPYLVKYSPSYKINFLNTIQLLPEPIFQNSNIFDIDSITRSYIRYPLHILEMPEKVAIYLNDENLFKILKGTISSQFSIQIFLHLYQFFTNRAKVVDFWSDMIDRKLMNMTIDDENKEEEAVKFFHQIKVPLNTIDHVRLKQFRSLSRIVELRPFLHYRKSYSFSKLKDSDFLNDIISLCCIIDQEDVIFDISESFGIELNNYYFYKIHLQLVLGKFVDATETIQKESLKIDKFAKSLFYDSSFYFLYPLYKDPIFLYDNKQEEGGENEGIPNDVYKSVSQFLTIPKRSKKNVFLLSKSEAKSALNILISKHCSIGPALSLFISFQQFESANELLNSIENEQEKIDHFINDVCLPVVFNNFTQKFTDFIMKIDKNLEKTGFLWDAAIDFFTKKEMPQGLIFALQVENKLEDAAIVGFESLKNCTSFVTEFSILGNIIINLKTSINYRQDCKSKGNSEEILNSVVINQSKTYDDILEYLKFAELQLNINKFCIEKSIPFSHEYEIFSSDESATFVSALLFIYKQYELMDEMKTSLKLSKMEIFCKVCDILCKEQPEKIIKIVRKLTKEDRLDILKALAMTNNREIFFSVMYECFDGKEQEYLFLDYNLIVDSFAIAYASKNMEIIPLIAHKASLIGDTRTVHECEKILNRK
ncbi:hypothetical protein M9Y10_010957 [Tritrichomonas musculus]|uniref:HECT domain-containing protein n=1 Tax=Tritrichomonas musculus TaxID=1915356 RepID=A0ABR2IP02_9EUKA